MSGNQSKVDDKLRRLVREEVEAAIQPLRKQIAELKKELAGPEAGKPEKQGKAVSGQKSTAVFEAEDIARLRKKWKLKRDVFGEFFGVSGEEIRSLGARQEQTRAAPSGTPGAYSRDEPEGTCRSAGVDRGGEAGGESLNAAGRRRHGAAGFRAFHLTGCGD